MSAELQRHDPTYRYECPFCADLGIPKGCPTCGRNEIGPAVRALWNYAALLECEAERLDTAEAADEHQAAVWAAEEAEEAEMLANGWDPETGTWS